MKKLCIDDILLSYETLIEITHGEYGIRDLSMLESSIENTFATFDQKELYPTIESKAAHIAYSIINNHPFIDGNKRMGIGTMLTFLFINETYIVATKDELVDLGLGIANSNYNQDYIYKWIIKHKVNR